MWPFKKAIPWEQVVLSNPEKYPRDILCGDPVEHYLWTGPYQTVCPKCVAIKHRIRKAEEAKKLLIQKDEELNRLAELIVQKLIERKPAS